MLRSSSYLAVALAASVVGSGFGIARGATSMVTAACKLPVHTIVDFHLTSPAASDESKTGQHFGFVLLAPIHAPDCDVPADGSIGAGTITLAGPSGNLGHEGDLTLRLDSLPTTDGRLVTFDDQEVKFEGSDRKTESAILRLVPDAGVGAIFIHGKNVHLTADTPLETQLTWPATVSSEPKGGAASDS